MRKLILGISLILICGACSNKSQQGERYNIKEIVYKGEEIYQDYWEKNLGIKNNRTNMFYYEIVLTNERQDTVIKSTQFIKINTELWKGKSVFVTNGRII